MDYKDRCALQGSSGVKHYDKTSIDGVPPNCEPCKGREDSIKHGWNCFTSLEEYIETNKPLIEK